MEEKIVQVGIFWAVPNKSEGGWNFYEVKKSYPINAANSLGFIDYPYSHYDKWDDVRSTSETPDCYYYPRGRVLYDVNQNKHRIFADECLDEYDLQELIELFEIEDFELCRDEHYVSAFTQKRKQDNTTPLLTYNILRGKDKIGENLIEISYGDTKVLVELGKALDGGDELSDIEKNVLKTKYDAVVVSHYHADHAGLIEYKTDYPVYMGNGAYRIVKAMSEYHGKALASNIATYRNGKAFYIGKIKITPYLCDHSAFDSYMLLFEAGGKSILYTGDFRFHGRKNSGELLSRLPKKVNTLICEGTNVNNDKPCFSESELEAKLLEIMRQNKQPVFVLQSGTNIDRLVSVYRAAKRSGRILYEDNYAALIAQAAGGKIPRPAVFDDVYAFTPRLLRGKRKDIFLEFDNKRGLQKIPKNSSFVMLVRPSMLGYIKKLAKSLDLSDAVLIYSMWNGYKQNEDMAEFLDAVQSLGMNIVDLHTSGHASPQDIELLKQTVVADESITVHTDKTPTQNSIKFRTENGDCYEFLCLDEFFRREVYDGLQKKFGDITPSLTERVESELSKILELCLVDYFLTVEDIVRYAKSKNIAVGTGRGNVVGSLVAYALGITAVNPIKYALTPNKYFGGKLTKEIAVDFCCERRGEIFDYLTARYGKDRVAHIGYRTEKSPYIREHGSAVALSNRPIEEIAPMTTTKNGSLVTAYTLEQCRELGLYVIHILGWNKLTQIQKTIELVKKHKKIAIDFSDTACGYDDKNVFAFISSGDMDGVFGLESDETQEFMRKFKPRTIEELVAGVRLFGLQINNNKRAEKYLCDTEICSMSKNKIVALYNEIANATPTITCKPHDISYYGYITYQTAYLKCYYPDEFIQAYN